MNIRTLLYIRYFCLIIFSPFTIIFGFLIKLIRPFFLIRWSQIVNTRIGHHATNLDMYFLEKNEQICKPKMKYLDIFYKPGLISANKQLEKMWDKKIFTLPWFIIYPLEMLRKKGFFKEDHAFETTARDRHGLSDSSEPILKFNSDKTFDKILEIYDNNSNLFDLNFSFISSGLAIIKKKSNLLLNKGHRIVTRENSFKNIVRLLWKIFKKN